MIIRFWNTRSKPAGTHGCRLPAGMCRPTACRCRPAMGLHGPKFGCGLGQCGACTVLIDGKATRSCITSVKQAEGHAITTIEGLGSPEKPDPVQAEFIREQAAQCGYCTNGMIMTAKSLLRQTPHPTAEQVKQSLGRNLCRCATYTRILAAVLRAAKA